MRWDGMTEHNVKVQIQGCIQADEAEIEQAIENALSNLMAIAERGDIEFDGPEDMAHVAEQMIRASMDRMGIEGVVRLSVTCGGVAQGSQPRSPPLPPLSCPQFVCDLATPKRSPSEPLGSRFNARTSTRNRERNT